MKAENIKCIQNVNKNYTSTLNNTATDTDCGTGMTEIKKYFTAHNQRVLQQNKSLHHSFGKILMCDLFPEMLNVLWQNIVMTKIENISMTKCPLIKKIVCEQYFLFSHVFGKLMKLDTKLP